MTADEARDLVIACVDKVTKDLSAEDYADLMDTLRDEFFDRYEVALEELPR